MADQVESAVPLALEVRQRVRNAQFGRDVALVVALSDEMIVRAVDHLSTATGFLGSRRLEQSLGEVLEQPAATAVANLVFNFVFLAESAQVAPNLIALQFGRELKRLARTTPAMPFDVERAATILVQLGQAFPAVVRQAKASSLAIALGEVATEVGVVCDFRPVFDDSRTVITGLVPIVTLKIWTDDEVTETVLDLDQVEALQAALQITKQKLIAMRGMATKLTSLGEVAMPEEWGDA